MARKARNDLKGTTHHVYNRGIAKRTIFEHPEDFDYFLDLLSDSVARNEIKVHAYCLMHTHYHLLLEVREEAMAVVMHRIQAAYSRYFNRTRQRDGPLVRQRYCSKLVANDHYFNTALAYIEANPLLAGLCSRRWEYPYSSARARKTKECIAWLEEYSGDAGAVPNGESFRALRDFVARLDDDARGQGVAPMPSLAWLNRRSLLADGTESILRIPSPREVVDAIDAARPRLAGIPRCEGIRRLRQLPDHVLVTLLGEVCGMSVAEIVAYTGRSRHAVSHSLQRLRELSLRSDELREELERLRAQLVIAER